MGHKVRRLLGAQRPTRGMRLTGCLFISYLLAPVTAWSQLADGNHSEVELHHAVGPVFNNSTDSDGLTVQRQGAIIIPWFDHADRFTGIEWTQLHISQAEQNYQGQSFRLVTQNINPRTALGWSSKLGVSDVQGSQLLLADLKWDIRFNSFIQGGVSYSRDWIDSLTGIDRRLHYDAVNLSTEIKPWARITAVISPTFTTFSDAGKRRSVYQAITWDALPTLGITLQASIKEDVGSAPSNPELPRAYFNPTSLSETLTTIGWRSRIQNWRVYGKVSMGTQKVAYVGGQPMYVVEIGSSSPLTQKSVVRWRLGEKHSSGLSGPDYTYRYVEGELLIPF